MRYPIRLFAAVMLALPMAGCHHADRNRPLYWHEQENRDRNPDQHWSRGPHIDH